MAHRPVVGPIGSSRTRVHSMRSGSMITSSSLPSRSKAITVDVSSSATQTLGSPALPGLL